MASAAGAVAATPPLKITVSGLSAGVSVNVPDIRVLIVRDMVASCGHTAWAGERFMGIDNLSPHGNLGGAYCGTGINWNEPPEHTAKVNHESATFGRKPFATAARCSSAPGREGGR
jgi:hypothetical protein